MSQSIISLADYQAVLQNLIGLSVTDAESGKVNILRFGIPTQYEEELLPSRWFLKNIYDYSLDLETYQLYRNSVALPSEKRTILGFIRRPTLHELLGTEVVKAELTSELKICVSFTGNYEVRTKEYITDTGKIIMPWQLVTPTAQYALDIDNKHVCVSPISSPYNTRPLSA